MIPILKKTTFVAAGATAGAVCLAALLAAGPGLAAPTTKPAAAAPATRPAADAYPLDLCPVSDEPITEMGKPLVKEIDGRTVKFCCAHCVEAFQKEPEKYNKKMDEMIVAKEKASYPLDTCVVTGEKLGGDMGAPVDYVYRPTNRLVRFCCDGCVDSFKKTPGKYLAMLDKATAAK